MEYSMKHAVSVTLQNCYHSFNEKSFLDWIKKWPTQFLLAVLDINLTNKLKKVLNDSMEPQMKL